MKASLNFLSSSAVKLIVMGDFPAALNFIYSPRKNKDRETPRLRGRHYVQTLRPVLKMNNGSENIYPPQIFIVDIVGDYKMLKYFFHRFAVSK